MLLRPGLRVTLEGVGMGVSGGLAWRAKRPHVYPGLCNDLECFSHLLPLSRSYSSLKTLLRHHLFPEAFTDHPHPPSPNHTVPPSLPPLRQVTAHHDFQIRCETRDT